MDKDHGATVQVHESMLHEQQHSYAHQCVLQRWSAQEPMHLTCLSMSRASDVETWPSSSPCSAWCWAPVCISAAAAS